MRRALADIFAVLLLVSVCGCGGPTGHGDVPDGGQTVDIPGDVRLDGMAGDTYGDDGRPDSALIDSRPGDGVEPDANAGDEASAAEIGDSTGDMPGGDDDCGACDDTQPGDTVPDVVPDSVDPDIHNDSVPGDSVQDSDGADVPADGVATDVATQIGCAPAMVAPEMPDCDHDIVRTGEIHETCVVVPDGQCHTFWMGAVPNELYIVPMHLEVPRHEVHLTSYALSRFPVTVREYRACVAAGECDAIPDQSCLANPMYGNLTKAEPNLGDDAKLDHPVNCVSWADATAFCNWLGGDLPTEAQFEYASAGPMTDAAQVILFPWGSDLSGEGGGLADSAESHVNILPETALGDPFPESSPVGFFDGSLHTRAEGGWTGGPDTYQTADDSSPFGLHDMTHNVLEMMKDFPSVYATWNAGMVDPLGPQYCVGLTVRNTSWRYESIVHARVTERHFVCLDPDKLPEGVPYDRNVIRSTDIGFRCAFDVEVN